MSDVFIGEIRAFGFTFAPRSWVKCNGQLLNIEQSPALFALLGTRYGGNGRTTFGVPNLNGRVPIGHSMYHPIGAMNGWEQATVQTLELPNHGHDVTLTSISATLNAVNDEGLEKSPGGHTIANNTGEVFSDSAPNTPMHAGSVTVSGTGTCDPTGGNLTHDNMQPFLVLNYCIAIDGLWPSRP